MNLGNRCGDGIDGGLRCMASANWPIAIDLIRLGPQDPFLLRDESSR